MKLFLHAASILLFTLSIFIIGNFDGYWDALGIAIALWANNIDVALRYE